MAGAAKLSAGGRGGEARPDRYGVIGWPLAHTWSPRIHRLFAEHCDQALTYDALPVAPAALAESLHGFFRDGGCGLNVTVPHKEAVMAYCTRLTDRARQAGAVNTLAVLAAHDEADAASAGASPGLPALLGDNTDGAGLVRDLHVNHQVPLHGARVLMLGAGGAVRGAVGPLLDAGCREIVVANRTPERAHALVDDIVRLRARATVGTTPRADGRLLAAPLARLADAVDSLTFEVVINATSAGLTGEVPPVPDAAIAGAFCYDMLYGGHTPFADRARQAGARGVATGLGMLVEQAAESFALWRGVRPPVAPVHAVLGALTGE